MKILIVTLSILVSLSHAQSAEDPSFATKHKFVIETDPNSIKAGILGQCYLVDSRTEGRQYKVEVETSDCRPENVYYQWINFVRHEPYGCYERGGSWRARVNDEFCRPRATTYIFERATQEKFSNNGNYGNCFEVDSQTLGDEYRSEVSNEFCRDIAGALEFVQIDYLGQSGCYEVGSNSCETYNRLFSFVCRSMSKDHDANIWINSTDSTNCNTTTNRNNSRRREQSENSGSSGSQQPSSDSSTGR